MFTLNSKLWSHVDKSVPWSCECVVLYCFQKNLKSPLCSSPAATGCEVGNREPAGWKTGQDDSAVHGKHLPPSPRRQTSSCSLPVQPPSPTEDISMRNSLPETPTIQILLPDMDKPTNSADDGQLSPPKKHPAARSLSRQKVLSRKTQRPHQEHKTASGQLSVRVPWDMEKQLLGTGIEGGDSETQEKGLLEEIESMCRISMAFESTQELIQNNSSRDKSWDSSPTLVFIIVCFVFWRHTSILHMWRVCRGV